ncbi:uncharacterized protein TNCV_825741 [Trichonephila clavipes]|nr:uncharacterized protein TNCV_825741 [Trichonephila clavipes]
MLQDYDISFSPVYFSPPRLFSSPLSLFSPVPTSLSPPSLPDPFLYIVSRSTCCQWVPSYVGIDGYEKADLLARTAHVEEVSPTGAVTFSELYSLKKTELHHLRRNPGGSFKLISRKYHTVFSRFVNGHMKAFSFHQVRRYFQSATCAIPSSSLLPMS